MDAVIRTWCERNLRTYRSRVGNRKDMIRTQFSLLGRYMDELSLREPDGRSEDLVVTYRGIDDLQHIRIASRKTRFALRSYHVLQVCTTSLSRPYHVHTAF